MRGKLILFQNITISAKISITVFPDTKQTVVEQDLHMLQAESHVSGVQTR